jgi:hypothetical protein
MKVDYDILLKALIMERERILETCSELAEFQKEIDEHLTIEDPYQRAKKINELLIEKLNKELIPAMYQLRKLQSKIEGMSDEDLSKIDLDKESA